MARSSCGAGRRRGGTEGHGLPSALPAQPVRPAHLVDEAVVHQLSCKVLRAVSCSGGTGRGVGQGVRPPLPGQPCPGSPPHPWVPAQHTWKEVVGELPVQPVLQHQKQRELRKQEGKVGCRRRPSPTLPPSPGPGSRASAPCPHFSPGYIASGSPGGGRAQGHPQGSHLATEGPEQRCLKGAQKEQ